MASIPLPALAVQQPQSPVDQYGKLLQMKSLLGSQQLQQQQIEAGSQENQMRQLQIQDAQTARELAQDPKYIQKDPSGKVTGFDYDGYTSDLSASGVGPQMLSQVQTLRKNAADTMLTQAQAQGKTIENHQAINKQAWEKLEDFKGLTDPAQRAQTWPQLLSWAQQNGADVGHLDPTKPPANADLAPIEAGLAMHTQAAADAKTQSETQRNTAQALLDQNKADMIASYKKNPNLLLSQVDAIVDPKSPLNARTKFAVQRSLDAGDVDGAKEAIKAAGQEVGALEKEKYVQGQESMRQNANRQAMQSNELQKNGLGQLDKMFTDPQHGYTQFLAQANSTKSALADAKDGNELAASLAPLMTVLGVNSFAGIHRVNPQEIAAAGSGVGSLYRQANTILDKAASGKMNDDTRKEMGQVIDGLIAAKHASLVPAANLVVRNAGLDPTKTSVLDKDGSVTTLDKLGAGTTPAAQPKTPTTQAVQVGQMVSIKGMQMKVTAVHADGSFDAQ